MVQKVVNVVQNPSYQYFLHSRAWATANPSQVFQDSWDITPRALNLATNTNQYVSETDYKKRIALKQNATNNYVVSGWKNVKMPYGWQSSRHNTNGTSYSASLGWFGVLGSLSDVTDSTLDDIAVKRVKRKLGEQVKQASLLAPTAELRELRGLVRGLSEASYKVVLALADIKRTKGKSAYKFASDMWLSYSFGVKPMMADVKNIAESVFQFLEREDIFDRVTGSASKTWVSRLQTDMGNVPQGYVARSDVALTHKLSYRYIYGYAVNWRSANDYGAAEHLGLEPPALIPAFWELTAWSWLFDYFSTIGDWLDDEWTSDPTRCIYAVQCKRYTVKANVNLSFFKSPGANVTGLGGEGGVGSAEFYHFKRTAIPTLPNRILRLKTLSEIAGYRGPDQLVGDSATNKLLNLVSVLLQRRR